MQQRLLISLLLGCLAASPVLPATNGVRATWVVRRATIHYAGFTTYYTCDGIEGKVRQVLLHLGARADLSVRATGCTRGVSEPSPLATIDVRFHSLAPASKATASDTVATLWSPFQLGAGRPFFMGSGECELIEQMRGLIENAFSLRDLHYTTHCVPHQVGTADYTVSGQVLRLERH